MTKRGIVVALALAVAFAVAFEGTASAQGELTLAQAKQLAKKLGRKQVRKQKLKAFHLGRAHRLSATAVSFPYDARTQANTYCRAKLRVVRRGNSITATIGKQRCIHMPDDALAAEVATRKTLRAMRKRNKATLRSVTRLKRQLKRCADLKVPKKRRAAAAAIIDIGTIDAIEAPNDAALGRFVRLLGNVEASNRALADGIAAWTDYVAVLRSLPQVSDPCATLHRWEKKDWAADERPVDVAAWHALDRRAGKDEKTIGKAARYLARVGVFPEAVISFTPEGLLLRLVPQD